uniref:Caveolin n=1 Tax=Trichogramma kaykai TaxID=54128 RepID=A0ABD2VWW9_9HYME
MLAYMKTFKCPKFPTNFKFPGMDKTESSIEENSDFEDRDPGRLNQHMPVIWEQVIGEPDGVRSPECAWRLSHHCFRLSKSCCYVLLSIFVAPIAALILGFTFACLAFEHIWCIVPCLRAWRISCMAVRHFCTAATQALVRPCTEALGYLFHQVRVMNQKLPDTYEINRDDVHII